MHTARTNAGSGAAGLRRRSRPTRPRWRAAATAMLAALAALALAVPAAAAHTSTTGTLKARDVAATTNLDPSNAPLPLLELGTPASAHFYTLNWQEAQAAVANNGFTMEPNRTGYVRPQPFTGSVALYRMHPNGRAAYLVTADVSEKNALLAAGGWTLDGIIGYAAGTQQTGTVPLLRYSSATEWRLELAPPNGPDLTKQGYHLDGTVAYVYPQSIRAGAIYFGNWDANTNPAIIQAGYDHYGRTYADWWAGVRDFYEYDPTVQNDLSQGGVNWPASDFADLEPSIGYYDDSQTATLEKQITQATGSGLDYFEFYWYWNGTKDQEIYDTALHTFLQANSDMVAAGKTGMDFSLQVCAANYDQTLEIPVSQYGDATTAIVNSYLSQSNYLRANNGAPVIDLCDTRGIGSGDTADVKAFVDMLRSKASAATGLQPEIMVNQDLGITPSAIDADGDYTAADYAASLDKSYQDYVNGQRAHYAAATGTYLRGIMSRIDERPRYPWAIPNASDVRYQPDWSFSLYTDAVNNALTDIQQSTRISPVDNFLLVYAWNEWDEGGTIEPDVEYGCEYLNILQQQLSLPGSGCVADPSS